MPNRKDTANKIIGEDLPTRPPADNPNDTQDPPSGPGPGDGPGTGTQTPATTTTVPQASVPSLSILSSPTLHWYHDVNTDKWYAAYYMPHSGRELIFEAEPTQMDALFGAGQRPSSFVRSTLQNLTAKSNTTFSGNVAKMEGTGTFEGEVQRVTSLSLDEGTLPSWAQKDGAAMDILYVAQAENKSNDWVLEQLKKLPSFKQRFPGLDKLQTTDNLSLGDAISGFLQFEAGTRQALISAGKDPNMVTPTMVGDLLNKGYSLTDVQSGVKNIVRASKFKPALDAFNSILHTEGYKPLTTPQQVMDFMSGQAPAEMYDLWEASSVAEAAQKAGLGRFFTAEDAIKIGLETDQTIQTATQASQKAAELLLRLRHEVDVGAFGLNHEDLIDLSFGRMPRSGKTESELNDSINRAVAQAQASLKRQATPYRSFSSGGIMQDTSLKALRNQT